MGNTPSGNIADCCCESRSDPGGMQDKVLLSKVPQKENPEKCFGVGLVFRTTRDGKMVVSSFVKDSSAYDCGLVRDGDILCAVQGQNVDTLRMDAIQHLLLGEEDSWVQMRFLRQTDAKASKRPPSVDSISGEPFLGQGPTDTVWASSKMRSFAPTYDSITVDLCRKTPSNILSEAASQAQEEALSTKNKRR